MNKRTNIICINAANRIKHCRKNELLTNGVVLRISRILAGVEHSAKTPKTKDKIMNILAQHEATILREIFDGKNSKAYVVIPTSLAFKIDNPKGETKSHKSICLMIKCVLNDEPAETGNDIFDDETDFEREQMRRITGRTKDNQRRKQKERDEKRKQELSAEERAAFEKIWTRHPAINRGQQNKAISAYVSAIRKGAKLDEIERGHLKWCNSDNWKKQNGAFVTNLKNWLEDEKWKCAPPDRRTKQERERDAEIEGFIGVCANLPFQDDDDYKIPCLKRGI